MKQIEIDQYNLALERECKTADCGKKYSIGEYWGFNRSYFSKPYNYLKGCENSCLECWLGVSEYLDPVNEISNKESELNDNIVFKLPENHEHWYDVESLPDIRAGNWRKSYQNYIDAGCIIAVLPLSRVSVDKTILLPYGMTVYPAGMLNLTQVEVAKDSANSLSAFQTKSTFINVEDFSNQPVILIPFKSDWQGIFECSHKSHMKILVWLSEVIDLKNLNYLKYKNCELDYEVDEGLPASAGQLSRNQMISAALLLNGKLNECKLIAGAAFSTYITRGLGLCLEQPEWDHYPQGGEMAQVVNHALSLYAAMLKTDSATTKFVQALSLLEFLALTDEFTPFKETKKFIVRYQTKVFSEYQKILERFKELTGNKDKITKKEKGFRTCIVHMGDLLENIVTSSIEREALFKELDSYIRNVIDHMIKFSNMGYEEYKLARPSVDEMSR
jgi:hypothetical protein